MVLSGWRYYTTQHGTAQCTYIQVEADGVIYHALCMYIYRVPICEHPRPTTPNMRLRTQRPIKKSGLWRQRQRRVGRFKCGDWEGLREEERAAAAA